MFSVQIIDMSDGSGICVYSVIIRSIRVDIKQILNNLYPTEVMGHSIASYNFKGVKTVIYISCRLSHVSVGLSYIETGINKLLFYLCVYTDSFAWPVCSSHRI